MRRNSGGIKYQEMLLVSLDEKEQWWKYQEMLPVSLDEKEQWWRLQKMLPASLDEKKQWWIVAGDVASKLEWEDWPVEVEAVVEGAEIRLLMHLVGMEIQNW